MTLASASPSPSGVPPAHRAHATEDRSLHIRSLFVSRFGGTTAASIPDAVTLPGGVVVFDMGYVDATRPGFWGRAPVVMDRDFDSQYFHPHSTALASEIVGSDYRLDGDVYGGMARGPLDAQVLSVSLTRADHLVDNAQSYYPRAYASLRTLAASRGLDLTGLVVAQSTSPPLGTECRFPYYPVYYGDSLISALEADAEKRDIPAQRYPVDAGPIAEFATHQFGLVLINANGNSPIGDDYRIQSGHAATLNTVGVGNYDAHFDRLEFTSPFTWLGSLGVVLAAAVEGFSDGSTVTRSFAWLKPEVMAAGTNVRLVNSTKVFTVLSGFQAEGVWPFLPDTYEASGSSFSAPIVAAVAAWIRFRFPSPVPACQVRAILFAGCRGYARMPKERAARVAYSYTLNPKCGPVLESLLPDPGPTDMVATRTGSVFGIARFDAAMLVFDEGIHLHTRWEDLDRASRSFDVLHDLDARKSWIAEVYSLWREERVIRLTVTPGVAHRLVITWDARIKPEAEGGGLVDLPVDFLDRTKVTSLGLADKHRIVLDVFPVPVFLDCGATRLESLCDAPYRAFDFTATSADVKVTLLLPHGYADYTPHAVAVAARPATLDTLGEDWEEGGYQWTTRPTEALQFGGAWVPESYRGDRLRLRTAPEGKLPIEEGEQPPASSGRSK